MRQTVVVHSSVPPCDPGQKHVWVDVSYEAHGIIRVTHQQCRDCEARSVLRNDGSNIIMRMAEGRD